MARTPEEEERRRRRRRLLRGIFLGGTAIGIPALANLVVSRRAARLPRPEWGGRETYAWELGEIAFWRIGEGRPVVLVHSLGPGFASHEWHACAELLGRHYRVLVLDLVGWGESSKPDIRYDPHLYVRQIVDFLNDVVGRGAVLLASGLPGAYAVEAALEAPELVLGLGLSVPRGLTRRVGEPTLVDAVLHSLLRTPVLGPSALNVFTTRQSIRNHLRREVFARPDRVDERLVDLHYRNSHLPGAQRSLAAYVSGDLRVNVRRVLGHVKQPLWIAWGRQATSPAVETSDLWLHEVPHAGLDVLEECGRLPHAEAPERFYELAHRFLEGLDSGH